MSVPRPLTKEVLKRMVLKVLHEHERPGGRNRDYRFMVRSGLPEFFEISPLSEDELKRGLRAVYELERDGFIMQDPAQSSDKFKVLTDRGKRVVEQSLEDMKLPSVDIDQLLARDDLVGKVHDDYLAEDHETAIWKAFKLLEETVRSKANLSPQDFGAALMSKAFNPSTGLLKHPDAQTAAEDEGFHLLMRGAIQWFKNPPGHRTVGYDDPVVVAQALALANPFLDMVDQCQFRS